MKIVNENVGKNILNRLNESTNNISTSEIENLVGTYKRKYGNNYYHDTKYNIAMDLLNITERHPWNKVIDKLTQDSDFNELVKRIEEVEKKYNIFSKSEKYDEDEPWNEYIPDDNYDSYEDYYNIHMN